jgi:hypothetical protein
MYRSRERCTRGLAIGKMRQVGRKAGVTLFGLVTLAGCGIISSPADGLRFQAPNGWHSSPGIMGIQFWKPADKNYEFLMLHKFKPGLRYNYIELFTDGSLKRMRMNMSPTRIIKVSPMRVCGSQDATYFRGTKDYVAAGRENAEATFTVINDTTYLLLYVYPLNAMPNREAETALRELCPRA